MTGACPTLDEDRILAFVAGELPIEGRRDVEDHVDDCETCRAVLAAIVRKDGVVDDATSWKPGRRIGRYVIRERIGRGGMGEVFRAEDLELGRPVALKRLHAEDDRARTSLLREARAAALLQHPNVVAVYEVGDHHGAPFIAMELVDGTTLTAWLRAVPRTWHEIVAVLAQAGRGLAAAHARGLVHRDFKPDNVLVDASGRARVADFGLARVASEAEAGVASGTHQLAHTTTTSALAGTPAYLAPELVHGEAPGAHSDQYAFGVAAFEALHGRYPFAGDTATEIWMEMAEGRIREGGRYVPKWLDRRVRRALAVDAAARWPDMAALTSELERRPRRRLIAIAAAVAIAAAGYAIVHQPSELCVGGKAEVAGIWNMPTKVRTRAAFLATRVPSADYVWQLIDKRLGNYGDNWSLMHREVCEATRRGEQSEQVMDLRMSCLRQRLQELSAAADVLLRADSQLVSKGAEIASSLSPLAACADVEALRTSMPTLDPVSKAEVTDVRDRLARVKMLTVGMNYKDAMPAAVDALARARATLYQPVVAEALLQVGTIQVARIDPPAADTLEQAFLTAEASGYDSVAIQAATRLATHIAANLSHRGDGSRWLRIARAMMTRHGGGDRDAAAVANTAAALLDADGHYDEALAEYARELAIRDKSADRDDEAIAAAHGRIGWILITQRHPEAALKEFRLAIARAETALGPDSPVVETQHRNIGAALDALGRYDEALVEYRRALASDERILGPKHLNVATLHSNIGGVLFGRGENDQALVEYRLALAIENDVLPPEHHDLAIVHDNIGKALVTAGKLAEGLAEHRRALAILEAGGNQDHPEAGQIHVNLGTALRAMQKYDEATEQYRAGLAILIKAMGPEHPNVAIAYLNVGSVLAEQGKFDQALVEQRRALAIQNKALGPEHPDGAITRNNIAVTLAMQGKLEDALVEWSGVLAVRVKVLGPQHPATASTMADIGKAEFMLHRSEPAIQHLRGALAILAPKSPAFDGEVAELRFDLAQALWSDTKTRPEALTLARQSHDDYAKLQRKDNLAEVDAWLAKHGR